jgi:hypothetical protein
MDKLTIAELFDRVEGVIWNGKTFTNYKDYEAEIDRLHTAIFGRCEKEKAKVKESSGNMEDVNSTITIKILIGKLYD